MRRRRGALAVLATLSLSLLAAGFAGSAAAGGPTSVLLVDPDTGRTASLYNSDPDYSQLADLVGAFGTPGGSATPPRTASDAGPAGSTDASGSGITLTWLMHDVTVWRVDRVFLKAENGPLIATQTNIEGGDIWSKPPLWRSAATEGKALMTLMDRLGVGNAGASVQPADQQQAPAALTPVAPASTPTAAEPAKQDDGLPGPDGWIWGPVGLLLGLGLALAVQQWRIRSAETNPDNLDDDSAGTETEAVTDPADDVAAAAVLAGAAVKPRTETLSSHSPSPR